MSATAKAYPRVKISVEDNMVTFTPLTAQTEEWLKGWHGSRTWLGGSLIVDADGANSIAESLAAQGGEVVQ